MNVNETKTAVKSEPKKKSSPKKKAEIKNSPFSKNAAYCENFDPEKFVKEKRLQGTENGKIFEPLTKGGIDCMGQIGEEARKVLVPQLYITAEGYRAWLRAAFPEYSIIEEEVSIKDMRGYGNESEKPFVVCKLKIYRTPNDQAPFSAIGYSRYSVNYTPTTLINFARADALKRALINQGFGDGLDWEYKKSTLQTYVTGDGINFETYEGPIYSNGVCIRERKTKSAEEVASQMGVICYEPDTTEIDIIEAMANVEETTTIGNPLTESPTTMMLDAGNTPSELLQQVQTIIPDPSGKLSKMQKIINEHNKRCAALKDDE